MYTSKRIFEASNIVIDQPRKQVETLMVTDEQHRRLSSHMIIMILDRVAAVPLPRHRYGDERTTLFYF